MSDRPIATVWDRLWTLLRPAFWAYAGFASLIGGLLAACPEPGGGWEYVDLPDELSGAAVRSVEWGGEAAELRVTRRSEWDHGTREVWGGFEEEYRPVVISWKSWGSSWYIDEHGSRPARDKGLLVVRFARWGLLAFAAPAAALAVAAGVWRRVSADRPRVRRSLPWRAAAACGRAYLVVFALFGLLAFTFPLFRGGGPRVASHWRSPDHAPGLSFGWARPATPEQSADTLWRIKATERRLGLGFAVQQSSLLDLRGADGPRDYHVHTLITPRWPLLVLPLPFALLGLRRPLNLRRPRRLTVPPLAGPASEPG